MSHKVWNAASFLNLLVLKVSTNGKKINSVETRCFASSPRQVSLLIIYPINRRSKNLLFIQFWVHFGTNSFSFSEIKGIWDQNVC